MSPGPLPFPPGCQSHILVLSGLWWGKIRQHRPDNGEAVAGLEACCLLKKSLLPSSDNLCSWVSAEKQKSSDVLVNGNSIHQFYIFKNTPVTQALCLQVKNFMGTPLLLWGAWGGQDYGLSLVILVIFIIWRPLQARGPGFLWSPHFSSRCPNLLHYYSMGQVSTIPAWRPSLPSPRPTSHQIPSSSPPDARTAGGEKGRGKHPPCSSNWYQ